MAGFNGLNKFHHAVDDGQEQMDTLLRLRCMVRNLPAIWGQSGRTFSRLPPKTPVVLCAYGASLLNQLDQLRAAAGSVLIMATARAAAALIQEGLQPRVVVALSSWAEDFWQVPTRQTDACLVAPPEVDPVLVASFGHVLWLASFHSETQNLEARLKLELPRMSGGATGDERLMLARVAMRLGCDRTALLGFDYCLDAYERFFPERERSDHEEAIEAAGIEGRTVKVTHELNREREAFEKEIGGLGDGGEVASGKWVNGSRRGAHIEGTLPQPLSDFLEVGTAHISRHPVCMNTGMEDHAPGEGILLEEVAKLRQVAASFGCEGVKGTVDLDALRQEMENMIGSGQVLLVEPGRFMRKVAGNIPDTRAPVVRRFARELASEMEAELKQAMDRRFARTHSRAERVSVHVFPSLKQLGCALIELNNPELAKLLREMSRPDLPPELNVEWASQRGMRIEYAQEGEVLTLTEHLRCTDRIDEEVRHFVAGCGLDPRAHGLVVLGPADWRHTDALLALFPELDAVIVEPWVGLLHEQLERTDLLSANFQRLFVVGLDQRLPSWAIRYSQRLNLWRAQGRKPVYFIPPALRKVQRIRVCYDLLKRSG